MNNDSEQKKIEYADLKHARYRFLLSLIFLIAGFIYLIWPIDIIPDILIPLGWVDDIFILIGVFIYSFVSYRRVKKAKESVQQIEQK